MAERDNEILIPFPHEIASVRPSRAERKRNKRLDRLAVRRKNQLLEEKYNELSKAYLDRRGGRILSVREKRMLITKAKSAVVESTTDSDRDLTRLDDVQQFMAQLPGIIKALVRQYLDDLTKHNRESSGNERPVLGLVSHHDTIDIIPDADRPGYYNLVSTAQSDSDYSDGNR